MPLPAVNAGKSPDLPVERFPSARVIGAAEVQGLDQVMIQVVVSHRVVTLLTPRTAGAGAQAAQRVAQADAIST